MMSVIPVRHSLGHPSPLRPLRARGMNVATGMSQAGLEHHERWAGATRVAIIAGGSVVLWGAIIAFVVA